MKVNKIIVFLRAAVGWISEWVEEKRDVVVRLRRNRKRDLKVLSVISKSAAESGVSRNSNSPQQMGTKTRHEVSRNIHRHQIWACKHRALSRQPCWNLSICRPCQFWRLRLIPPISLQPTCKVSPWRCRLVGLWWCPKCELKAKVSYPLREYFQTEGNERKTADFIRSLIFKTVFDLRLKECIFCGFWSSLPFIFLVHFASLNFSTTINLLSWCDRLRDSEFLHFDFGMMIAHAIVTEVLEWRVFLACSRNVLCFIWLDAFWW